VISTRAHVSAAALFLLLAALMLWPLPRLIEHASADRTTSLVNVWIQDWDWYATFHRGAKLFRAEAEHQYGVAVFGFPFRAAGAAPLLTHNLLLLLGFAFTGYGAFVLARVVTGSWWAGVAAGMVLAFVPWRFANLSHTQLMWAGWLPLMLAALIVLARDPRWPRAVLFGVTVFLNGITSLHWLAFGSTAIAAAVLIFLIRRPKALLMAVAVLIVVAAALIPFVLPYQLTATFDPEWPSSPGWLAVLLALIGLIGPVIRDASLRHLVLATAVLWILLGTLGSLAAFPFVPLTPGPWAMVAYTGLALLVGIGTLKVVRHRHLVGALIAGLLLWELHSAPLQWQLIDTTEPYIYRRAAKDRGPIVELPENRYEYLFRSTIHHRPLIFDDEIYRAFQRRPIDLSVIELMKARGATALLIHGDGYRGPDMAAIQYFMQRGHASGRLNLIGRYERVVEGDYLFTFERGDLIPYFGPQPAPRPFGWLDEPQENAEVRGPVRVMGWTLSPDGIQRVRVFVDNRARVHEAQLFPRPDVKTLYPWHDTSRSGFTVDIPRFREGPTDVEVEITDGRGRVVRLPQRWFVWMR
jgi:hypothetical protein